MSFTSSNNAMRDNTPFPHDASAVLQRGTTPVKNRHLVDPDVAQSRRAIPSGGRFRFQRIPSARQSALVMRSQRIAKDRGAKIMHRTGFKFFGTHSDFNWVLQAANIKRHYYADFDIIYAVKSSEGIIIAQGTAEFLKAIYDQVPFALAAYWQLKKTRVINCFYIRRYFAFNGCYGPLRDCLYRFHGPEDLATIHNAAATSPSSMVANAYCGLAWVQNGWKMKG
ncbi:hypothetical protein NliqN6_3419 [Naganishia liquefaciens]|uniref:Uncharacterized protein n=1 Tax=Naganishia liquefaciens TaxID=104408 RepID=A0A8H3TTR4_9TREE|nr:hypothetical protein NliqN6_3419 [Naganishia liquefaciens]